MHLYVIPISYGFSAAEQQQQQQKYILNKCFRCFYPYWIQWSPKLSTTKITYDILDFYILLKPYPITWRTDKNKVFINSSNKSFQIKSKHSHTEYTSNRAIWGASQLGPFHESLNLGTGKNCKDPGPLLIGPLLVIWQRPHCTTTGIWTTLELIFSDIYLLLLLCYLKLW